MTVIDEGTLSIKTNKQTNLKKIKLNVKDKTK